jgi:hypothetical protein
VALIKEEIMKRAGLSLCVISSLTLLATSLPVTGAKAAEECNIAVQAAMQQWRTLSDGRLVAPAQRVMTSDGRVIAGSAINYARVLIDRAASACEAGHSDGALAYVSQVQTILPNPLVAAKP